MLRTSALGVAAAVAALIGGSTAAHATATTQLLVKFKTTAPSAVRADALDDANADPSGALRDLGVTVVKVNADDAADALATLRASGAVAYAERDVVVRATSTVTPTDPLYAPNAWPYANTAIPYAWSAGTGAAVTVAVVDTGVNASIGELSGSVLPGYNAIDGSANAADDFGHGTEVASLIAGHGNNGLGSAGVCWSCKILPVKALGSNGSGSSSNIARGITWAADHGAKVINLSLGGGYDATEGNAVAYARGKGAVVVASAGNNGNTTTMYPAGFPGVISVAASDAGDNRYSFSTYGGWVQVAAPGCVIAETMSSSFGWFCGTSAAAPMVSGIAALAFSDVPSATGEQVTQAIIHTTDPVPGAYVGHGRVNAARTLSSLGVSVQVPGPTLSSTAPPTVSGQAAVGQVLTGTSGTWQSSAGTPSYTYQWQRCLSGTCTSITGATAAGYTLAAADQGATVRLVVTAHASTLIASATSAAVGPVGASGAPVKTGAPGIAGVAQVGQTLTGNPGSWQFATGYTYSWLRCGAGATQCAPIAGATATTYRLASADAGSYLAFRVTASNGTGSATATSGLTAQVAAAPAPVPSGTPLVSGSATVGSLLVGTPPTWQNAASTTYQWLRCSAGYAACVLVGVATTSYTLTSADLGKYLTFRVTAVSPYGPATTVVSRLVGPVA
jgi:Subtilase family